ncbi:hypothetical protein [Schlesneria sp. T3-172]|uniref:hypothetical protein n=1 Tax=Schlesneria sphaerica TaxID=3373610 RepID=UPI0037C601F3
MQVFFEPIWSWPLVILTSLGLVVLVYVTYQAQLKRLPRRQAQLLLTLRMLAVLVLTFAIFRPAIQTSDTDDNPVQLLILADTSRSMNTSDMPGGTSRFSAVRADLSRYEAKWKELGNQVTVRQFDFDRGLAPHNPAATEGTGDQTAFGAVLEDVIRETRDHRSLGLLLLTDGAQRAIPPYDADPLTAARKLGDSQVPIYAVVYGTSSLSTASLDLAVEDLRIDPIVFEKKLVPISCKVRAMGARGKKIRVRVLLEDRTGKRMNESGEFKPAPATYQAQTVKEFEVQGDAETLAVDLSFVPQTAGELKVAIQVESDETELLTRNNRRETIVSVKKGGLNVAYFDQLRPEQSRIRMVNGADKIQLEFQEVRAGRSASQTKLDRSWFEPGRFDVYLIGDVRAEWFGNEILEKLAARVEDGAGLLMIGGLQNFATGGYALTPLADLLPVKMDAADYRPIGKLNPNTQYMGDVKLVPTERGLKEFVMQLGSSDKNRSLWTNLPTLEGATRLRPVNDLVRIWAETADKQPLLLVNDVGKARVAAFGGDSTWLWCLDGKADLHQRFWRQMILWLAKKEADTDQPVWVNVDPRNFAPGSIASILFGARTADGRPAKETGFEIEVTKPDGQIERPSPRQLNDEHSAEFSATSEPGDYWVRVSARRSGDSIPEMAYTRFIVDARDLELDYPSADHDFLKELASVTGGTSLKPEELGSLIERLKQTKYDALTRIQITTLWDNWWLLLTFVGLMSCEWFLRKKAGLV